MKSLYIATYRAKKRKPKRYWMDRLVINNIISMLKKLKKNNIIAPQRE